MRRAQKTIASLILAFAFLAPNGGAVTRGEDPETAVRRMVEDLRSFADGSWFESLFAETAGRPGPQRIAEIRKRVRDGLDRHDETFRRLPATTQEAFLEQLLDLLSGFRPIQAADRDSARLLGPLESWRKGYRAHLATRYTKAWESRTETLLRFLRTLRLLPGGQNLWDGSLEAGCIRYVHERYGSTGDTAVADAQLLLVDELQRFEGELAGLGPEPRFDLWCRWRAGLRSAEDRGLPVLAPGTAVTEESRRALHGWALQRAFEIERRLRTALHEVRDELSDPDASPAVPGSRLASILDRSSEEAVELEARKWWCQRHGPAIEATGVEADPERQVHELLATLRDVERGPLLEQYENIVRSVRRRRLEEALFRARTLDADELAFLKRELRLRELDRLDEDDR